MVFWLCLVFTWYLSRTADVWGTGNIRITFQSTVQFQLLRFGVTGFRFSSLHFSCCSFTPRADVNVHSLGCEESFTHVTGVEDSVLSVRFDHMTQQYWSITEEQETLGHSRGVDFRSCALRCSCRNSSVLSLSLTAPHGSLLSPTDPFCDQFAIACASVICCVVSQPDARLTGIGLSVLVAHPATRTVSATWVRRQGNTAEMKEICKRKQDRTSH